MFFCLIFAALWLVLSLFENDRRVAATQRCTSAVYVVGVLVLAALA